MRKPGILVLFLIMISVATAQPILNLQKQDFQTGETFKQIMNVDYEIKGNL